MTIVTSDELADYLNGVTWSLSQTNHIANVVLPGIQQELENYLNRPIEPMHVREARQPDCDGRIWPTVTPVIKMISIDYSPVGGSVQTPNPPLYVPAALSPDPGVAREWDPAITPTQAPNWLVQQQGSSFITIPGFTWDPSMSVTMPGYVLIEYIGGYNGYIDTALKLDILRVAAREVERVYDNAVTLTDGAAQQKVSSDPRTKGWTPDELAQWDRLRRRVVVS